jgi:hypothetical protein
MVAGSMFISLGFALLDKLLLGRHRGGKASFEALAADSRYPVKIFSDSLASGAKQ